MKRISVYYMLLFTGIILFIILLMQPLQILHFGEKIAILFPKGKIALEQRNLLFIIQLLMLLVIIPVYILTFIFSWIYRADNPKGKYDPDIVDNVIAEYIWWGLPCIMVLIIGIITGIKTFELDPFKPIAAEKKEMTIQVVALQWKWLFIYPDEKIATVNFVQFPKDTPIRFEITADAPMNSFWIPYLAGQIYAMPTMKTVLNLIANESGDFVGSSANLSGEGFAGMTFVTRVSSDEDYQKWVKATKESSGNLDYKQLAIVSKNNPVKTFQLKDNALFDQIVHKHRKHSSGLADLKR